MHSVMLIVVMKNITYRRIWIFKLIFHLLLGTEKRVLFVLIAY